MKRPLSVAVAIGLAVACSDQSLTGPESGPLLVISDGVHNAGNPDFFFLPPLVPDPSGDARFESGAFNPNLSPVVEVCHWVVTTTDGDPVGSCAEVVARFSMTSGLGSEVIRVNTSDQNYLVNWHTDLSNLDPTKMYRIEVSAGSKKLGFADVDVVSTAKELRNVQTGEYVALLDGRTLPIKFRIEEDALCDPQPGAVCNASSETVDLGDGGQVELRDETTGKQVGVLTIQPQLTDVQVTFTLQQCDQLDIDLPQFGDCLRITSDPALESVVPAGLDPPARISICRTELIGERNPLITLHRQDDHGNVYALPHANDDCEDIIPPPGQPAPAWDMGQQPAGDSPFTSRFRNALPAKMDYVNPDDAERTSSPSAELPSAVKVTDANNGPVAGAHVTFMVTDGGGSVGSTEHTVTTGDDGIAQVTWTLGATAGANGVQARGRGIASRTLNGPADGFDPFWPGLHQEGVEQDPVQLHTGTLDFIASGVGNGTGTVDLTRGGSVELRDETTGGQIGVLTIRSQSLPAGTNVTFTLQQCAQLDIDLPQFGDCLRITSEPALESVVPDGLDPPANISICRTDLIGERNPLITLHRQDDEGNVYALPHADDHCEDIVQAPGRAPSWDVGQQPAGDSPFTSRFRNALPVKMDYENPDDAARSAAPGTALATRVKVTDANGELPDGARVTFEVTNGLGTISAASVLSVKGIAEVTWTLGAGANTVVASGRGIASPTLNGPAEGFDPFWPGLHDPEVVQHPVLLETGTLPFTATGTTPVGNTIFRATFTADALNAVPGAPEIGAWTGINQSTGTIRVRSAVGDLANRPVELNQADGCCGSVSLVGTVAGMPPTTGRWVARWRSLINSSSAFFAPIVLRGSGGIIASVEYRLGGQLTYNTSSNDIGIDWTQGTSQLFEVLVDLDAHVTSLYVNGTPVPGQQNVAFVQPATSLTQIGAELGGTFAQIFAWDDIEIGPVAQIDGVIGAAEWDGADVYGPFTVNLPGGATTTATLRLHNDQNNLLAAVQFGQNMSSFNLVIFSIRMDEDQDGQWDLGDGNGEDGYVVQQRNGGAKTDTFIDEFFSCDVQPEFPCQGQRDDAWGGANNGSTASTENPGSTIIEVAHPLNGSDPKDVALSVEQTLKFFIHFNVGPSSSGLVGTFYPGASASTFASYVVK